MGGHLDSSLVITVATASASHGAGPQDEDLAEVQLRPRLGPYHFNQERHLISRDLYRERRSAALAEWRALAA